MKPKTKIQIEILKAGITQNQIADATGITSQTVYQVMVGRSHNQVVQEYIARILGESPEQLWGNSYAPVYRKQRQSQKPNTEGGL
jgi:lambda repressor-like predicted transcriptional regulator